MKIYIGIKYTKENLDVVKKIKEIISALGHQPYCFFDEGDILDKKQMMEMALRKIQESDVVLLDSSYVSFGVGIEAGFAFAKKKRIITLLKESAEKSGTLQGVSDQYLIYSNFEDLKDQLRRVL